MFSVFIISFGKTVAFFKKNSLISDMLRYQQGATKKHEYNGKINLKFIRLNIYKSSFKYG